jgi:salicylate hydroxylase
MMRKELASLLLACCQLLLLPLHLSSAQESMSDADTDWGRAVGKPLVSGADASSSCTPSEQVTSRVNVALVGGGLVGLAVAIGLDRKGIDAMVYERSPQLRCVSQGILGIQPNGMSSLENISPEILPLIAEKGCERLTRLITTITEDGSIDNKTQDTGRESLEKYGRHRYGITWHNMQQVLASLLPPEKVVTNHSLTFLTEREDGVELHFENGSVVLANVVLACDGVFSVARRLLFPNDSPIYFGQLNWGTIIETTKLPADLHLENGVHYYMHTGEPRWMSMINDGGNGYTFWQFRLADPVKSLALSGNGGRGGLGLAGVKKRLLPVARISNDVSRAIISIPEAQIFERSIVARYPLPTWIRGRVALVGDSAHGMHPNIGQGANSAFESAAAIVEQMSRHSDWRVALEEYEKTRKPRADIVQRFANMMGVSQATGKEFLTKEAFQDVLNWILSGDSDNLPSKEIVEMLEAFDPCTEEGVSLLW